MATLSQHYDTNFDVNPYYVPINKQLSPMYDKSKKTWSQRLKITKSEKSTAQMVVPQLPPPPQLQPQQLQLGEYPGGLDFPPSALSRSMKYAEPWIYGTVRGIPARPMHFLPGQAMFAPMPSEIAVVICSCPEYLNGTKRDVKKASVCKKCKGSRLPLAPIGGTVRIRPTSAPLQHKLRPTNASTLRVVSSKSRPSILDPQRDPYDLMRRTRLLSPEPKCSTPQPEKGYRSSRGKSSSPNRSRSRTPRSQLEESGKASPKQNPAKTDRWIVEDGIQPTKDTNHRRSILRCNVNPYDLISNKSSSSSSSSVQHLSEFSPNHHDDDDDDVVADIFGVTTSNAINQRAAISRKTTGPGTVSSPSPSTASSSTTTNGSSCSTPQTSTYTSSGSPTTSAKTMNYANVKAIAGQRISFGESTSSSSLITQNGDSFSYASVTSVPLNAESSGGSPKLQKQQSSAKKDDNPIQTKATTNQPKRPPRRKNDMNPSLGGSSDDNDNSVVTAANPSNEHHYQVSSQTSTDPPAAAASQRPSIKSILKRPPPSPASTATSPKSPSNGDTDAGSPVASTDNACRFDHHHRQQHHHQIKRNSARTHESPAKSPPASGSATFPAVGMDTKLPKSTGERKTAAETKTGSQFYIPLPQARKKVQFMVEDKIIRVEHNDGGAQRDDEVNDDNDNANDNDHDDDDDDEDDYHSAQGDDDDRNEISKQISKPRTANNQDGSRSRSAASTSDTNRNLSQDNANEDGHRICENKVSSNVADVTRNPKDNKASPPVAAANRFSHEQQHYSQRRHQIHLQQQQQEAVLNQLQHESNLVSSELLNSPRGGGYYQNLLHRQHQRQDHRQDHHQDEPHYEDVADEHVDDDNEDEDDDKDDEEDEDDDDRQTVVLADDSSSATDPVNGQPRTEDPSADDLRTVTKAATTASTTTSPTSGALSRNAIRRTHSERHPCNVNIGTSSTNVILNFKDTMALRMKATRKDSRDVFSGIGNGSGSNCGIGTQQSVGLFRPKEPPPPPPTPGGISNLGNHKQQHQQQPKQQQQVRLSNTRTNVTAKETPQTPVAAGGSSKTQTILITATKNDSDDKRSNNCDIADDGNEDAATKDNDSNCQQRGEHPTSNRRLSVSRSGLEEQKQPLFKGNDTSQRRLSSSSHQDTAATKNIYETFDSFSQADPSPLKAQASPKYTFGSTSQPNRTVVRVAPFNKTSSEVHRLKITHTDEDTKTSGGRNFNNSAGSQKKTSILITGDDCYSTVNVTNDTPLYQSSVVVADGSSSDPMLKVTSNTVTINVVNSSPRTAEEELIYKNNKINTLLSRGATRAIIPIGGGLSNMSFPDPVKTTPKRGRTLITLDYEQSPSPASDSPNEALTPSPSGDSAESDDVFCHEEELVKILRNPVEAVRRNLVPHICGKADSTGSSQNSDVESKCSKRQRKRPSNNELTVPSVSVGGGGGGGERHSFVSKLLEDPTLSQLADGLESDVVVKLIENSLKRLQESRSSIDTSGTKDNEDMNRLINSSLQRIKEERHKLETNSQKTTPDADELQEIQSNRGSISSGNSFSSANYEMFDFSDNNESDCYQSCSSEIAADIDTPLETRSKFYQMLVDATLAEIEISMNAEEDHHYESIRGVGGSNNGDPIYEEINDIPPPLPLSPPPLNDPELEKKAARSMFEGASKYDILSYLVDAKERGLVREESFEYNINNTSNPIIIEEENDTLSDLKQISDMSSRISHLSVTSDSSEDTTSLTGSMVNDRLSVISALRKGTSSEIERNDSGVGSETSKSSRSKYQNNPQAGSVLSKISPIHLCEDCDGPVETQVTDSGVMFAPLVCRKCGKKRAERKEIITEIVETEEKYGRDLQIILEEFCQPMLVAGLLTQEQLSAIFLNTEELLENNQTLAERMRDALDIALEQGDDDLLTVNIGKIFLEFTQMLHAFESYCVRQAGASLLLANLEKEKELLRIFLKVSQMENTVLRRMNLNSFLMVPVQRVTKYPLLLARLYKVTPSHLEGRDLLKQAQEKIELHLTHINQEAKDVPTKLWRRISSSSPNRRASCEIDMINIKLRKMAIDILEWNHDEVRFAMEGRLLYTQPTDSNWKKARTIKLNPVNALLVTNGKPSANYKAEKAVSDHLNFPKHTGIREASLLVVKEKCGRYTLIREPLYLDRCIVCTEADWDEYFELQEISSKDTFIFKAEDGVRTKQWYTQLQYHAQGMGAWRKRRNALANIMINGMLSRT